MAEITTTATKPRMYRHKLKAAKRLGNLWVKSHTPTGDWEAQDGDPVFFAGDIDIRGHGIKYFEIPVDGEVTKVKPVRRGTDNRGKLVITLTDNPSKGEKIERLLR